MADHFVPLCLGGPDTVDNLWWEDWERSLEKDDIEREACRQMSREERRQADLHIDVPAARAAVLARYLQAVTEMGGEEWARARVLLSLRGANR